MKTKKQEENFSIPLRPHPVCLCNNVFEKDIVRAIRKGSDTLNKIKKSTKASTGCGTCEPKVWEILKREKKKLLTGK